MAAAQLWPRVWNLAACGALVGIGRKRSTLGGRQQLRELVVEVSAFRYRPGQPKSHHHGLRSAPCSVAFPSRDPEEMLRILAVANQKAVDRTYAIVLNF